MMAMEKVDNVDFGMDEINIDIDEVDNDNVEVTCKSTVGCAAHWQGASQERLPERPPLPQGTGQSGACWSNNRPPEIEMI